MYEIHVIFFSNPKCIMNPVQQIFKCRSVTEHPQGEISKAFLGDLKLPLVSTIDLFIFVDG